jgi:hypothetical protein
MPARLSGVNDHVRLGRRHTRGERQPPALTLAGTRRGAQDFRRSGGALHRAPPEDQRHQSPQGVKQQPDTQAEQQREQ